MRRIQRTSRLLCVPTFSRQHKNVVISACSALVSLCFSLLRMQVRFGFGLPEDLPLFLQRDQMQQCDTRVSSDDGPQR